MMPFFVRNVFFFVKKKRPSGKCDACANCIKLMKELYVYMEDGATFSLFDYFS